MRSDRFGAKDEMTVAAGDDVITFGKFVLDPVDGRLFGHAGHIHLGRKSFMVLEALVARPNRLVARETLFETVWNRAYISESVLTVAIKEIRKALGDQATSPQFIESVYGRGYRFVAPVNVVSRHRAGLGVAAVIEPASPAVPSHAPAAAGRKLPVWRVALGFATIFALGLSWLWLRPAPAPTHSMMVRLSGFKIPADLSGATREAIDAEIIAAFNVDGVIGVSSAAKPSAGSALGYSLGGMIYHIGDSVRVITRLTNERSGAAVWSDSVDYASGQASTIPHKIAVHVGTVVRCGLSGAATYHKAVPDAVLSNYMQYCQEYWAYGGSRTLQFAQRVVAAVPDFSWGWSAVGNGYMQVANAEADGQRAAAMRAAGRKAEDKALALDRGNSEALAHKAYLIDQYDWGGQETLFKGAIAANPLDCGCEHYGYGHMLLKVGRLDAAVDQFRAATDILSLWSDSQIALARTLVAAGRGEEAKPYFRASVGLSQNPNFDKQIAVAEGVETHEYPAAIIALRSLQLQISDECRVALLSGYEALASGDPQAKRAAVQKLLAVSTDQQSDTVATMLAALGARREALQAAARRPWLFWNRTMREVLNEPSFVPVAKQLGLITYWRSSRTKPDICVVNDAPPFCRTI